MHLAEDGIAFAFGKARSTFCGRIGFAGSQNVEARRDSRYDSSKVIFLVAKNDRRAAFGRSILCRSAGRGFEL